MTARTVPTACVDGFFCRYGAPVTIYTDQGSQFESKLFKDICNQLDIKKTRTTAYHPAGDGLVECLSRTLENMLSSRVNNNHNDCDLFIQQCIMTYRSSLHSSTKETPAMLTFGREVSFPVDVMFIDPRDACKSVNDHLSELKFSL